MNLGIIAEGVETTKQLECLLQEGCVEIQGYLFARPMPLEDVTQELIRGRKKIVIES